MIQVLRNSYSKNKKQSLTIAALTWIQHYTGNTRLSVHILPASMGHRQRNITASGVTYMQERYQHVSLVNTAQ